MKLTVYRQASKTRPSGTVVYKGEDARPYVDGQIFFVADGLGGAAAIRHQNFKSELFDKDKLMKTLFDGVYEDYSDERFVQYVTDSFFELFAVKDCYTDNIYNIKKSGYFGSRLVSAILLHEMLYNEAYSAKSVFELHEKAAENGKAEDFLTDLGAYFKTLIQDNLRKIAKNANLVNESVFSGLALLGTTLCATVYYEHEDSIEAIYLTAGDSRPYVWDAENGLCQLLPDQERSDGGMTNYVRADEGTDFHIRCNYFKFNKPCVLFNATDGCFDSGMFISQLAFEKTILDSAKESDSVEALSEALTSFFVNYGRHDDSSTIAMRFFGYDSYESFKKNAAERSDVIEKEYFSVMPDLLDEDYAAVEREALSKLPARVSVLKDKFESENATVVYCTSHLRRGKYKPYVDNLNEIDGEIAVQNESIRAAKNNVAKIVRQNFVGFRAFLARKDSWNEKHYNKRVQSAERKYRECAADYLAMVERCKISFDKSAQALNELLDRISEKGVPKGFEDFNEISYEFVADCEKTMDGLFALLTGIKSGRLDAIRSLIQQRRCCVERNVRFAYRSPEDVAVLTQMILDGRINLQDARISSDARQALTDSLMAIENAHAEIKRLGSEVKEKALRDATESYWGENYMEIISAMVNDHTVELNDDVRNEAIAVLNELNEDTRGAKEKSELQKQLFSKYDQVYNMYIGGSA